MVRGTRRRIPRRQRDAPGHGPRDATRDGIERSGASAGDKTILDSLVAIRAALASGEDPLDAAQRALDEFRTRETKIGRARIYGAKSAGHDDPGMLAALLLLRVAKS